MKTCDTIISYQPGGASSLSVERSHWQQLGYLVQRRESFPPFYQPGVEREPSYPTPGLPTPLNRN